MSTYLLLRDNKESGPYSLDELRSKGLKAYDLVWIEGRSAAWRYPSEVEELKSFAPIVEEQPFDRFFKRPAQNSNASVTAHNDPPVASQPRPVLEKETSFASSDTFSSDNGNGSMLSGEPSSVPGKKIIYVTLPAGKSTSGMRVPSFREPARVPVPVPVQETRTQSSEKEPARTELSSLYKKSSPPAEEKFSRNSDEMWKGAVELTPRQQGPNLKRILQPVAAITCVLALLAAGIFIGLSIKSDSFGFSQKIAVKESPVTQIPAPVQDNHVLTVSAPVTNTRSVPVTDPNPSATTNANTQDPTGGAPSVVSVSTAIPVPSGNDLATAAPVQTQKKKADKPRNRSSLTSQKLAVLSLPAKDSTAIGLSVVHREATHRTDETGFDKGAVKSSISNMVSIGSGKYTVGTFGGISDFPLTVSNHSLYPIDLVVVEVQYIQANKKVFKTENLYFRGLGPGAAMMQEAPKSARGIKVQYKITLINSKELGLSYSGV